MCVTMCVCVFYIDINLSQMMILASQGQILFYEVETQNFWDIDCLFIQHQPIMRDGKLMGEKMIIQQIN